MTDVYPSPVAGVLGWAGSPSPDGREAGLVRSLRPLVGVLHPDVVATLAEPPAIDAFPPTSQASLRALLARTRANVDQADEARAAAEQAASVLAVAGPGLDADEVADVVDALLLLERSDQAATLVAQALAVQPASPRLLVAQAAVGDDDQVAEAAAGLASLGWLPEAQAALVELDRRGAWTPARRVLAAQVVLVAGQAGALDVLDEASAAEVGVDGVATLADAQRANGDFDDALATVDRALAVEDDNVLALAVRAVTLAETEAEGTLPALERAVEVASQPAFLLTLLGSFLAAADRVDEAIAAFDRAIESDALYGPARLRRSSVLVASGRAEEALVGLEEAILAGATSLAELLATRGDVQRFLDAPVLALASYTLAIDRDPAERFLRSRAECAADLGRYDVALRDLGELRTLAPEDPGVPMYEAQLQLRSRAYEEAEQAVDAALALDPDSADAHELKAQVLSRVGRTDEALAELDTARQLDPDRSVATARVDVLRSAGRTEEAERILADALVASPNDVELLVRHADVLLEEGSAGRPDLLERGLAELDVAIPLAPRSALAIGTRGQLLRQLGRRDEALAELDRALALGGELGWVLSERARLLDEMNRNEEALQSLERAARVDAGFDDPLLRARLLGWTNRTDEALEVIDGYLAEHPSDDAVGTKVWILYQRDPEAARALLDESIPRASDPLMLQAQLAMVLKLSGHQAEALEALDGVLAQRDAPYYRAVRADVLYELADYPGAVAEAERVLSGPERSNDADALASRVKASAMWQLDQDGSTLDEAMAAIDHAIELDHSDAESHRLRAAILLNQGRPAEAAASAELAGVLNPGDAFTQTLLAAAYLALGRPADAVNLLRPVTEALPDASYAWTRLGEGLTDLGELEQAAEALARACDLDQDSGDAALRLGQVLAAPGRDGAEPQLRRAVDLDRTNATAWIALVSYLQDADRLPDATAAAEGALAALPDHPDVIARRGLVHLAVGETESGLADLERAADMTPSPEARQWMLEQVLSWHYDHGDHAQAVEVADRILEQPGASLYARQVKIDSLRLVGRPADALPLLDAVITEAPADAWGWGLRGQILVDLGRADEAFDDIEHALAIDPEWTFARIAKIAALQQVNRHGEALPIAAAPAEAEPDSLNTTNNAFLLLGVGDAAAARIALDAANEDSRDDAVWLGASGMTDLRLEDAAAAEPQLRRALDLTPDTLTFRCYLADALIDLGRLEDAAGDLRGVLEAFGGIDGPDDSALLNASWATFRLDGLGTAPNRSAYDEASRLVRRALSVNARMLDAPFQQALFHLAYGHGRRAEKEYGQAMEQLAAGADAFRRRGVLAEALDELRRLRTVVQWPIDEGARADLEAQLVAAHDAAAAEAEAASRDAAAIEDQPATSPDPAHQPTT